MDVVDVKLKTNFESQILVAQSWGGGNQNNVSLIIYNSKNAIYSFLFSFSRTASPAATTTTAAAAAAEVEEKGLITKAAAEVGVLDLEEDVGIT